MNGILHNLSTAKTNCSYSNAKTSKACWVASSSGYTDISLPDSWIRQWNAAEEGKKGLDVLQTILWFRTHLTHLSILVDKKCFNFHVPVSIIMRRFQSAKK